MSGFSDQVSEREDERQRRYLQMVQKVKNNSAVSSNMTNFGITMNGIDQQFSVGSVINNTEQNLYPDQSMQQTLPNQQLYPGQPLTTQQFYNSKGSVIANQHRPVELASNAPSERSVFKMPSTTGHFYEFSKFKREIELLMPNCYEINKANLRLCLRMFKAAIHHFRYPPQGVSFLNPAEQVQYIGSIVANQYYSNRIAKSLAPSIVSDQRSTYTSFGNNPMMSNLPTSAPVTMNEVNPPTDVTLMHPSSGPLSMSKISTNQSTAMVDIMSFLNDSTTAQRRDERAVQQHSNDSTQHTLNRSHKTAVKSTPKPKGLNKSQVSFKKTNLSVVEEQKNYALPEGGKSVTRSGRVIRSPACFWKANDSNFNSTPAVGKGRSNRGRKLALNQLTTTRTNSKATPSGRRDKSNDALTTLNENKNNNNANSKKPAAKKEPAKKNNKENTFAKPKKPSNSKKQSNSENMPVKAAKQTEDDMNKEVLKKRKPNGFEDSLLKKKKKADVSVQQQSDASSYLDDDYSDDDLFSDLLC